MTEGPTKQELKFGAFQRLYGEDSLAILAKKKITVIGMGGVGSWAVESLCRSSIKHMQLIDLDEICITNTNRQLHTTDDNIGKLKVCEMKKRCLQINPEVDIQAVEDFINEKNLDRYLHSTDLIVDCIDSVSNKASVIHYAIQNKIPIITTGASGGKINPALINVSDLGHTQADALLFRVRKLLKRRYQYPQGKIKFGVTAIYSPEPVRFLGTDGVVTQQKSGDHKKLDCQGALGSASFVTGSFGFFAAAQAIDQLLLNHRQNK